jgi:hypothetical protein
MDIFPYKGKVIRGRETRWYRVPQGLRLKEAPPLTHRIEAKIEQFSPTLWIFTLVGKWSNVTPKHFTTLEGAENCWRIWLERRTEAAW